MKKEGLVDVDWVLAAKAQVNEVGYSDINDDKVGRHKLPHVS